MVIYMKFDFKKKKNFLMKLVFNQRQVRHGGEKKQGWYLIFSLFIIHFFV